MTQRTRLSHLLILSSLALAACGGGEAGYVCQPECPAGFQCTTQGCVSDSPGGNVDLMVTVDAAGCSPACSGATPVCNASGHCVACVADGDCPMGTICKTLGPTSATCVAGCNDDSRCGGGGRRCCGGGCVDTMTDGRHCGACDTACMTPHAGASCVAGQCAAGACQAGWGDCNNNGGDGCESNLRVDTSHCGACGAACSLPNAIAGCSTSGDPKCYIAACQFGFDDCNSDGKDGCEVNVLANAQNCGACGIQCVAVARGKNTCVVGGCQLTSCDSGYADCDAKLANGCEVGLNNDILNCGQCGVRCGQGLVCIGGQCTCPNCNLPNAKSACINLRCEVASCNINWGDCDGLPQNGCELNLTADAKNCGACGAACAQGLVCVNGSCTCPNCVRPNARTACVNNVCQLDSCFQGYGNCNNSENDGCEVNFATNPQNCGSCGRVCPMNTPVCISGACSNIVKSCLEVLNAGLSKGDGVYQIDPDGQGGKPPFDIYCDMTTDGGGWEVQAFIRKPMQWDWKYYTDNGAVGDTANGFSSALTLQGANDKFNEKIIIYLNLIENGGSLGKQWMAVRRMDAIPIAFSTLEVTNTGWSFRDSYGHIDANAGNICTHGCTTYRGNGMFHDHTGIGYHGTQTGDYGCRDGNNVCWTSRAAGCNVGATRCAYLTGNGEGVVYAVRNK